MTNANGGKTPTTKDLMDKMGSIWKELTVEQQIPYKQMQEQDKFRAES